MKTKESMEHRLDLSDISSDFAKKAQEVKDRICDFMQENSLTSLDFMCGENREKDVVYTYVYDCGDELREAMITGLSLVVKGESRSLIVHYITNCDFKKEATEIFGGEILGYFTAMNLAEAMKDYKF